MYAVDSVAQVPLGAQCAGCCCSCCCDTKRFHIDVGKGVRACASVQTSCLSGVPCLQSCAEQFREPSPRSPLMCTSLALYQRSFMNGSAFARGLAICARTGVVNRCHRRTPVLSCIGTGLPFRCPLLMSANAALAQTPSSPSAASQRQPDLPEISSRIHSQPLLHVHTTHIASQQTIYSLYLHDGCSTTSCKHNHSSRLPCRPSFSCSGPLKCPRQADAGL